MKLTLKIAICVALVGIGLYAGYVYGIGAIYIPAKCKNTTCKNGGSWQGCNFTSNNNVHACFDVPLPSQEQCNVPDISVTFVCTGTDNMQQNCTVNVEKCNN